MQTVRPDNWGKYVRRGITVAAAIAMAIVLCGASPNKAPEEVVAHMRSMADACKEAGGKPLSHKFVERSNLAEGLDFWIIEEGAFQCDGAASIFCGSGGCQVAVYLGLPNSHAKQVFLQGAHGIAVERSETSAKLWLGVGGSLCGQNENPTHAGSIRCDRPLRWDANAQMLEFAPLSEARFPTRLRNW